MRELTVDEMLDVVGGFSKFQWLLDVYAFLIIFGPTNQVLIMYFAALQPPWKCVDNSTVCLFNTTMPPSNQSYCDLPRDSWQYTEPRDFSVTTYFDIECKHSWTVSLTYALYFVGWGVGAVVLGWVADNYGRKIVFFPSYVTILLAGFIGAFSPNIEFLIATRFIAGFATPGVMVQTFVIISEVVTSKRRPAATLACWLAFATALAVVGLKAYFIQKWKTLMIVCSAPYLVLLVFYRFVPESVRWLRIQGRADEAMRVFHRIASWNGTVIDDDITLKPVSSFAMKQKTTPIDLFRKRRQALENVIQCIAWCIVAMVYYGVTLAADNLGGSHYLNFVLVSLIEFPAIVVSMYTCDRLGRKMTVVPAYLTAGVLLFVIVFIPATSVARVVVGMFAKFCVAAAFDSMYVWSVEIFPTTLRAEGMGMLQVTSRVGASTASFVADSMTGFHANAPFIVMGSLALVGGAMLMYLPETNGVPIADDDELEQRNGHLLTAVASDEKTSLQNNNEAVEA